MMPSKTNWHPLKCSCTYTSRTLGFGFPCSSENKKNGRLICLRKFNTFVPYLYHIGTYYLNMKIVNSREFRDHQKKYFDLVDQNEQIIVQRGKDKAYVIVSLNDSDRLSVNDTLIQTVREAEAEYAKRKTTSINDSDNIWESIL